MRPTSLVTFALVLGFAAIGCSGSDEPEYRLGDSPIGTGGEQATAGGISTSGAATTGGATATGATSSSSGATNSAGTATAGVTAGGTTSGGTTTGGATTGGSPGGGATTGGSSSGGATTGGATTGGATSGGSPNGGSPNGGSPSGGSSGGGAMNGGAMNGGAMNGGSPSGGSPSGGSPSGGSPSGGSSSGGSGLGEIDCNAAMPTGGQQHSGNSQGGSGNLAWQIWSNVGSGSLTTFSTPAFTASWNNSGDYLGRLGFEWGNNAQAYSAYGTIIAQYASKKTGSGGGYSYIGMYGWTTNPCVEWYIVDDSYNNMPVNPGNTTNKGMIDVDDGSYVVYTRNTSGTGGSRCSGVSNWIQYYSVRTTARECGQISLTEHFDAWNGMGMSMGNLLEAKILVEVGGGSGSVDFAIANVTTTQ